MHNVSMLSNGRPPDKTDGSFRGWITIAKPVHGKRADEQDILGAKPILGDDTIVTEIYEKFHVSEKEE